MSDTLETGGGAPPRGLTPAEDPALALNRGRPLVEGIEGGTSSQCVPQELREPFIQVSDDTVELVDPPQEDVLGQEEVEEMFMLDEPDEEALSAGANIPDDIKAIYKKHLLLDIEYKRLKMRNVQLEIKKLEKLREDD